MVVNGMIDISVKILIKNGVDIIVVNVGGILVFGSVVIICSLQDNDNFSIVIINNVGIIGQNSGLMVISINYKKVNLIFNNVVGGVIISFFSSVKILIILIGKGSDIFFIVNFGIILQIGFMFINVDNGKNYVINVNGDYFIVGNIIVNGLVSNSSVIISLLSLSVIKMGFNILLINYGCIFIISLVNIFCLDYLFVCVSGLLLKVVDGIFIDDGICNVVIVNYGSIIGVCYGIDGGDLVVVILDSNLVNVIQLMQCLSVIGIIFDVIYVDGSMCSNVVISNNVVINQVGVVIIGNNGLGVGFDSYGVVFNYGIIIGNYVGSGCVYDVFGNGVIISNGDGDGVDIDGIVYIENWGIICGNGVGGFDFIGQLNGVDGIVVGGGIIINYVGVVIYGDVYGIFIDDGNDWFKDLSNLCIIYNNGNIIGCGIGGVNGVNGVKVYIVNDGSIIGNKGIVIGLVGNYDDMFINNVSGVIIGGVQVMFIGQGGSIVLGVVVQMGGGNDMLINYGCIEGKNGLVIDMGDGDDLL